MSNDINSSELNKKGASFLDRIDKIQEKKQKQKEQSNDQQKSTDDDTFIRVFNELLVAAMAGNQKKVEKIFRYQGND